MRKETIKMVQHKFFCISAFFVYSTLCPSFLSLQLHSLLKLNNTVYIQAKCEFNYNFGFEAIDWLVNG